MMKKNAYEINKFQDSFNWMNRVLQAIEAIHSVGIYCIALVPPNQLPKVCKVLIFEQITYADFLSITYFSCKNSSFYFLRRMFLQAPLGGIHVSETKQRFEAGELHPSTIQMCPHSCILNLPKPRFSFNFSRTLQ